MGIQQKLWREGKRFLVNLIIVFILLLPIFVCSINLLILTCDNAKIFVTKYFCDNGVMQIGRDVEG